MTLARLLTCTVALASAGLLTWGASRQGTQQPIDQANPGKTTQGTQNRGTTERTVPDATIGKTADGTFAKKAAAGGMAEVKLGQLAQEKASNEQVKQFGKRMETDHTNAGNELMQIARKQNIALPTGLDPKDQATYDRLSKLSGRQFDRAYMRAMVTDHEEDATEFKREASAGKNPDLKSFASATLPTLEDHLKQAREVAQAVGATSGGKTAKSEAGAAQ